VKILKDDFLNKDLLSIVIPIYNSESTLDRCIKSIVNQKYVNFELILVDDGSIDNSKDVCQKWVAKDSRIKYYFKENEGAGKARNYGIEKTKGCYIGFVDSDDEILPDMYWKLINKLNEENLSIVGCTNYICDNDKVIRDTKKSGIIEREKLICDVLYQNKYAWGAVWNKVFKKELFNNLFFPSTSSYEDYCVTLPLFDKYSVFLINEPLYIHYENKDSLTHRTFNTGMLKGEESIRIIEKYFEKSNDDRIKAGCNCLRLNYYYFLCKSIYKSHEKDNVVYYEKIFKEIRKDFLNIKKYKSLKAFKTIIKIWIMYLDMNTRGVSK